MSASLLISVLTTFFATSNDDLTWLPLLLIAYRGKMLRIATGYIVGTLVLDIGCYLVSLVLSAQLSDSADLLSYINYVGFAFVAYGVWVLVQWLRRHPANAAVTRDIARRAPIIAGLVAVICNGWNNLIVLPALFIAQPDLGILYVVGVWLCNAMWAIVATSFLGFFSHRMAPFLARYGDAVSGTALILIGAKIVGG